MQELDALAAGWTDGALIFIYEPDLEEPMIRPAAFVYPTPGAITWVEPSYAVPYGTPVPALHTRAGTVEPAPGNGLQITDGKGTRTVAIPTGDSADLVGDALTWFFETYMKDNGRTFAEEREWVRAEINSD